MNRSLTLAARWPTGDSGSDLNDWADAVDYLETLDLCLGERHWLETDPTFRQIIPYLIVTDGERVLRYIRGVTGGEDRLHGQLSIGFGGHIDLDDLAVYETGQVNLASTLYNAAARELREELGVQTPPNLRRLLGLIVCDDTPVDQVHLGWVETVHIDIDRVIAAEPCIAGLHAVDINELFLAVDDSAYETWSFTAIQMLDTHRATL